MPNTYGVPVAFLAVPKEKVLAAAVVLLPDVGVEELPELPELPELLQAAAVSVSRAAAATPSHLRGFICASFGDGVDLDGVDLSGEDGLAGRLRRPSRRGSWPRAAHAARGARRPGPRA